MTSKSAILSFRFTGEDIGELKPILGDIQHSLSGKYTEIFCSLFKEEDFKNNQFTTKQIYQYCLGQQIDKTDYIAYIRKKNKVNEGIVN